MKTKKYWPVSIHVNDFFIGLPVSCQQQFRFIEPTPFIPQYFTERNEKLFTKALLILTPYQTDEESIREIMRPSWDVLHTFENIFNKPKHQTELQS